MCLLVPFYCLLLFSCVLSSSVIAESDLLCFVVLILSTVACVVVQSFVTYSFLICGVVAGFFLAVVNGILSV